MDRHEEWTARLMEYAREHYEDGWDSFYECMDAVALKHDCMHHDLGTWEDVFSYYRNRAALRKEHRDDMQAEVDSGSDDLYDDGDVLASAGWGTDEDYGYFGGED